MRYFTYIIVTLFLISCEKEPSNLLTIDTNSDPESYIELGEEVSCIPVYPVIIDTTADRQLGMYRGGQQNGFAEAVIENFLWEASAFAYIAADTLAVIRFQRFHSRKEPERLIEEVTFALNLNVARCLNAYSSFSLLPTTESNTTSTSYYIVDDDVVLDYHFVNTKKMSLLEIRELDIINGYISGNFSLHTKSERNITNPAFPKKVSFLNGRFLCQIIDP